MLGVNTILQDKFLEAFFSSPLGRDFYLTGGTALARFYLYHRESIDLDFFTQEQKLDFNDLNTVVNAIGQKMGLKVDQQVLAETFLQYIFKAPNGDVLKTDFVKEIPVRFGNIETRGKIRLDSLENIASNKILAVFGRTEPKDFVDLYFLLKDKGFKLKNLIARAKKKDLGLTEFYLANSISQVETLTKTPVMLVPFNFEKMKKFYQQTAKDLYRQIKPAK